MGGQDGARLDGHARYARVIEEQLDHGVGGGEALGDAAGRGFGHARQVARPVAVDPRRAGGEGRLGEGRRRQRLVVDCHCLDGVAGDVRALSDHDRYAFSGVHDAIRGEHRVVIAGKLGRRDKRRD